MERKPLSPGSIKRSVVFLLLAFFAISLPLDAHAGLDWLKFWKWGNAPTILIIENQREYPIDVDIHTILEPAVKVAQGLKPGDKVEIRVDHRLGRNASLPKGTTIGVRITVGYFEQNGLYVQDNYPRPIWIAKDDYVKSRTFKVR